VPLDSPGDGGLRIATPAGGTAPSLDAAMGRAPQGMSVTMAASEAEEGAFTPAPPGDPRHAELLLQLASRQSNLAKAYLARARVVTDVTLLRNLDLEPSEKQAKAFASLGSAATPPQARQDVLCALDVLDAAARNYAAAHAALPADKEAQTHADAASAFSEGALACAEFKLGDRARAFATCAQNAHGMFVAMVTAPGFPYSEDVQALRVQLECRLLASDAMPDAAERNHGPALQRLAHSLTTGTIADPAWDSRMLWLMASLLQELQRFASQEGAGVQAMVQ